MPREENPVSEKNDHRVTKINSEEFTFEKNVIIHISRLIKVQLLQIIIYLTTKLRCVSVFCSSEIFMVLIRLNNLEMLNSTGGRSFRILRIHLTLISSPGTLLKSSSLNIVLFWRCVNGINMSFWSIAPLMMLITFL